MTGIVLTEQNRKDLLAFLESLTDDELISRSTLFQSLVGFHDLDIIGALCFGGYRH